MDAVVEKPTVEEVKTLSPGEAKLVVGREIKEYLHCRSQTHEFEKRTVFSYLNNFISRLLPNSSREFSQLKGLNEIPHKQRIKDGELFNFSKLYLEQTDEEYYQMIGDTMAECGVSPEGIKNLKAEIKKAQIHVLLANGSDDLLEYNEAGLRLDKLEGKLVKLVFPVYLKLREIGYNYPDLTE